MTSRSASREDGAQKKKGRANVAPSAPGPQVEAVPAAAGRGPMYGPRFEAALAFANSSHYGQRRKGSGAPYVTHVLAVASTVGEYGGDEDQAIAALLHDVLEDTDVTEAQLAQRYGERVAAIVRHCSDTVTRPKPPWRERKERHLAKTRTAPPEVKLVLAADKLHNACSIVRDLHRGSVGPQVWGRFRADRADVLWYFRAMLDALGHGWEHELLDELRRTVDQLCDA